MGNEYRAMNSTNQSIVVLLEEYHAYVVGNPPKAAIPTASFGLYLASDFYILEQWVERISTASSPDDLQSGQQQAIKKVADCLAWLSIIGYRAGHPINKSFAEYVRVKRKTPLQSYLNLLFEVYGDSLIYSDYPHPSLVCIGGIAALLLAQMRHCDIDLLWALKDGLLHIKSDDLIKTFLRPSTTK